MTHHNAVQEYSQSASARCDTWIAEGWELARRENDAAFQTIDIRHAAEVAEHDVLMKNIMAQGSTVATHRTAVTTELATLGYRPGEYLRNIAQGRADLRWTIALFVLNAALAVLVLLAFGPVWLTILLALLVIVSALPVEEFFEALQAREALREGIFLTLSIVALAAQFWLGTIRGLFLAALTPADVGTVTHFLGQAHTILQYALGILSVASEILCGWKLSRARVYLLSATAKAVREHDRCTNELSQLYNAFETAKVEPEIRKAYRTIGARQYLAWAAGEERRTAANHLSRALKGALIALAALAVLMLLAGRLGAAPITRRTVIPVLDLSKSVSPENFRANVVTVTAIVSRLRPGDRVLVLGISDSFGRPTILLDVTMPTDSGYFSFQERAAHETILAQWANLVRTLRPTYNRTDVVGALSVIPYLSGVRTKDACIVVLSDLQNSTPELDLEHRDQIPVGRILRSLRQRKAIPRLDAASVFLLGVDPVGKNAAYFAALREFWFQFFREAGATVRTFSIDRRVPEF